VLSCVCAARTEPHKKTRPKTVLAHCNAVTIGHSAKRVTCVTVVVQASQHPLTCLPSVPVCPPTTGTGTAAEGDDDEEEEDERDPRKKLTLAEAGVTEWTAGAMRIVVDVCLTGTAVGGRQPRVVSLAAAHVDGDGSLLSSFHEYVIISVPPPLPPSRTSPRAMGPQRTAPRAAMHSPRLITYNGRSSCTFC
jgi:hypothetical protein